MNVVQSLWKKYVALPSPVDLGRSERNALPLRQFDSDTDDYTWENWRDEVRAKHPARYFLIETLGGALRGYRYRADRHLYRIKCAVLPSHRFHLVDLRKADPDGRYTHGYCEPTTVLLWCSFYALGLYMAETEGGIDPATWLDPESLASESGQFQKKVYDESRALWAWWTKGQKEELEASDREHVAAKALPRGPEREEAIRSWALRKVELDAKPALMLARLAAISPGLWT
jgi:hypothetical protein